MQPLRTFIIYSSIDKDHRVELERHLRPLVDLGWLEIWSDKEILAGENWDTKIKKQLLSADIFLMLVSVDFYNSGYIREEEFKTAVKKLESGESLIIPIIVRDCTWKFFPIIKDLQVLPSGGVAVTDVEHWKSKDKAWKFVVEQIGERIEDFWREKKVKEKLKEIRELELQIEIKKGAKNHATKMQQYEEAANLRDQESRLERRLKYAKYELEDIKKAY